MEILYKYLKRDHERGILDRWQLWSNTDPDQEEDRNYAHWLSYNHDWIDIYERHEAVRHPKQLNTGTFYVNTTDRDTVYLRFDDDIVYVHENAIERMVESASRMPNVMVSFPIIWNNAVSSWHLQQQGKIPMEFGVVGSPYCMDVVGWSDPYFAEKIHRLLLDHIRAGTVDQLFLYVAAQLAPGQQFSVSCFAVNGNVYADLNPPGVLETPEEEHWHTVYKPQSVGKSNVLLADALVAHLTFYPQRRYILEETDIFQQYKALADLL